uniref:Uncharacterized protein n=1 Tax=Sinocyclocheilus grahami TaxID=75366 RepID=A0A672QH50_SINGR
MQVVHWGTALPCGHLNHGAVRRILQQNRTVCSYRSGSAEGIREKLQAFPGGSIELQKQQESGIAVLTVNNPARMNAFSGAHVYFTYGSRSLASRCSLSTTQRA